ncbi:hypothetical protein CJA_0079 [Cellvibrio japonicus Ueda107]|uniref:Uncharacterized protein n=1 Tax=Cellvibrio japonicus (strain Ueda107) TaxID=498211 RepID=B3PFG3_CELJU|nr:hypothetical protein CJA_0079 [Cellvibrio japonicus Ueda107]
MPVAMTRFTLLTASNSLDRTPKDCLMSTALCAAIILFLEHLWPEY